MFLDIRKRLQSLSFFEIFISLSIITLVVFVVKYFGLKVEWKTIRVEVINKSWAENYNPYGYRTPFWLSDKIKVGQKEYGKSGVVIAEIIGVDNYVRGGEEAEVYLTVKVRTTYQRALRQYIFKDKPLDLGSAIEIAPDQNIIYGQIIDNDTPPGGYPKKELLVTGRGRGFESYFVDQIKVNDTMDNRYTKKPIATILEFQSEPASRLVINQNDGGLTVGSKVNQNAKDIVIKLRLTTEQIDNRQYFSGHQEIKVGNLLYYYGQNVNFNLIIEDVKEL